MALKKRDSCRESFKKMKLLPLCSQYVFSVMLCVVNNRHLFPKNSEIRNIDTRQNNNLHPPITSLTRVLKGAYCSGIKIYNHLPTTIKELSNEQKPFRSVLKKFWYIQWMNILNIKCKLYFVWRMYISYPFYLFNPLYILMFFMF
jgi:hypothetical protein